MVDNGEMSQYFMFSSLYDYFFNYIYYFDYLQLMQTIYNGAVKEAGKRMTLQKKTNIIINSCKEILGYCCTKHLAERGEIYSSCTQEFILANLIMTLSM